MCAGTLSGRPASAAAPTAIMAPEINPPGRFAQTNSKPPALPIASVSSILRSWARLSLESASDAVICFKPPYGKSGRRRQMRNAHAAMRGTVQCTGFRRRHTQRSSPGIAVQRTASLPLAYDRPTPVSRGGRNQSRGRGVLDHPVIKPGDDSCGWGRALLGEGDDAPSAHFLSAAAPLSAAAFLHSERNFLRSLPLSPLASASLEHSSDSAVRGFAIFLSVAAGAAVSLLAAGAVVVCARTGLANRNRDAKAAAATREDIVIMEAPRVEEGRNVALRC